MGTNIPCGFDLEMVIHKSFLAAITSADYLKSVFTQSFLIMLKVMGNYGLHLNESELKSDMIRFIVGQGHCDYSVKNG